MSIDDIRLIDLKMALLEVSGRLSALNFLAGIYYGDEENFNRISLERSELYEVYVLLEEIILLDTEKNLDRF